MKVQITTLGLLLSLSGSIYAADVVANQQGVQVHTQEQEMAQNAYSLSVKMASLTKDFANLATKNNEISQESMLQLSKDIGTMADRIGTMSDRIVDTQVIQSKNFNATQKNMLQAQKNMLEAVKGIDNSQVKENIQIAQKSLSKAMDKNQVSQDIAKTKTMDELIEKMNKAPQKERYQYMNEIKGRISEQKGQDREEKMTEVLNKINQNKEENKENTPSSIDNGFGGVSDSSSNDGMGDTGGSGGGMGGGGMF